MSVINLGTNLLELSEHAEQELLLVAPFIKVEVIQRLLEVVHDKVSVTCVTRWRPSEVAAGVSDLEIWDFFRDQPKRTLYLRHDLHAKFYRSDETCLVGSANLTMTALGWVTSPNYELLIKSERTAQLISFEEQLFVSAVEVDEDLYRQIQIAVDVMPQTKIVTAIENKDEPAIDLECWLPTLRTPEKLFVAYQGSSDELTSAAKRATMSDLKAFDVPAGLNETQFRSYIAVALLQMPLINRVDRFVQTPRRFGEVKSLIKSLACYRDNSDFDAVTAWQTLMRWLLHFLPDRYDLSVPRHSEIFARKAQ